MRRPGRGREACCARAASRRAARGTAYHQLSLFLSGGAMWPGTHKIIGMLMKNKLLHQQKQIMVAMKTTQEEEER